METLLQVKHDRFVALFDMDCFYASVESKRLGLPPEVPLGVQQASNAPWSPHVHPELAFLPHACPAQWGSLIALNYAAKRAGVKRGDSSTVAKQKCPSIVLPHGMPLLIPGRDRGWDRARIPPFSLPQCA